jgi:hypothetical protein
MSRRDASQCSAGGPPALRRTRSGRRRAKAERRPPFRSFPSEVSLPVWRFPLLRVEPTAQDRAGGGTARHQARRESGGPHAGRVACCSTKYWKKRATSAAALGPPLSICHRGPERTRCSPVLQVLEALVVGYVVAQEHRLNRTGAERSGNHTSKTIHRLACVCVCVCAFVLARVCVRVCGHARALACV